VDHSAVGIYAVRQCRTKERLRREEGWEIDPLSAQAWTGILIITAAKTYRRRRLCARNTFKFTHIDSWEIGQPQWTAKLIDEFAARPRIRPHALPAGLGRQDGEQSGSHRNGSSGTIAGPWPISPRRNYYGWLTERSRAHGMGNTFESGGPFFDQDVDGMECLGAGYHPHGGVFGVPGICPFPFVEGVSTDFFKSAAWPMPACIPAVSGRRPQPPTFTGNRSAKPSRLRGSMTTGRKTPTF